MPDVELTEAMLGYSIIVDGDHVGSIEGVPGQLEYIEVHMHREGEGIGRAALQEFVAVSRAVGHDVVRTNNDTHPAMEHILETEDFERVEDGVGWVKKLDD